MHTYNQNINEDLIINLNLHNTKDLILESNSKYFIEINSILDDPNISISIPKNSSLQIIDNSRSSGKLNCNIYLIGEQANFKYINQNRYKDSTVEKNIQVFHQASNTKSYVKIKNIAENKSHITGKVLLHINSNSDNCIAKQKIEFINLSSSSKINFTPILEIENISAISEHSFSIINLSPQDLFYFMSRGIDKKLAKKLILEGFLSKY